MIWREDFDHGKDKSADENVKDAGHMGEAQRDGEEWGWTWSTLTSSMIWREDMDHGKNESTDDYVEDAGHVEEAQRDGEECGWIWF